MIASLLEYIHDGVQIIDADGLLVYCNQVAAEVDDINIRDSLGKHILDVYPSLKEETSTMLKALKNGLPIIDTEQRFNNYKGKEIATLNTTLPILEGSEIVGAVEISRNITDVKNLSEEVQDLRKTIYSSRGKVVNQHVKARYHFDDIVTVNQEFIRVKSIAMKAAKTDMPILVYGETGTGKELLVQSIHNESNRAKSSFIAQNCAALPGSLLEGILFGTSKGGFTGAVDRPGLFEMANGGTLFLDEINSMPLELQAKLLRVLQDGYVRRVGDNKDRHVDVRVIAATNIEPNEAIAQGTIRRDLYYRLNTITIWIPRLRDRREDIPELVKHFVNVFNAEYFRHIEGVSENVERLFNEYPFEGNVRELEHVLRGSMSVMDHNVVGLEDLPPMLQKYHKKLHTIEIEEASDHILSESLPLKEALVKAELQYIHQALALHHGNISKAAKQLGIPRQTLQYKMKKWNI